MYTVVRRTAKKRMSRKLQEVKAELRRRMHEPIPDTGNGSLRGGRICPLSRGADNVKAILKFRFQIGRYWHHALRMRGSRRRVTWERRYRLIDRWLPPATVTAIPIL